MRFLNFGRVVDTTVLRTEFGYTPRYSTEAALADYARTVPPVVDPGRVRAAAGAATGLLDRLAGTVSTIGSTVGRRTAPAPPTPGLRAVRDA
jgi:UDP-glucose 4-epimerase